MRRFDRLIDLFAAEVRLQLIRRECQRDIKRDGIGKVSSFHTLTFFAILHPAALLGSTQRSAAGPADLGCKLNQLD